MVHSEQREDAQTASPQSSEHGARYRPRANPSPRRSSGHRDRGHAGGRGGGRIQSGQQTPAHPGWQHTQADQHHDNDFNNESYLYDDQHASNQQTQQWPQQPWPQQQRQTEQSSQCMEPTLLQLAAQIKSMADQHAAMLNQHAAMLIEAISCR